MDPSEASIIVDPNISVSTLSNAVQAAFDFAGFATIVETIHAEIIKLQSDFIMRHDQAIADMHQQQQQALTAINAARLAAILEIIQAKGAAIAEISASSLYRPAQHNQTALFSGQTVPTAE